MPHDLKTRAKEAHRRVVESLFDLFDEICEGAISVDRQARVVWINEKYLKLLELGEEEDVLGRNVEEIIPESMMREVVETGRPILLDIMRFGARHFVVSRLPLRDRHDNVTGAVGFVLYDKVDHLKPILSKFERLQRALDRAQQQLAAERRTKYSFSSIIGGSREIDDVKRQARRAAVRDSQVLLLGETGTGKELLAQAIHAASARASKPFVAVNVAAIPENLLEAEFFGVAPGAYTGADRRPREGKFQLADGGTLFLDEIGDMPVHLQAKLLRAVEEQEIEPLGSTKLAKVDVRVIAATSQDLDRKIEQGSFRSDLFYRLNVLPLRIPPLRDRLDDLRPLCDALLERIAMHTDPPPREIEDDAIALLSGYTWPGNIRELRNVLERACMLTDASALTAEHFREILPTSAPAKRRTQAVSGPVGSLAERVTEVERESIIAALRATGGKKAPAAKLLGISRSKLYEKLREYELSGDRT
ncbi:MAG: sigma 54-interacting transcriptional regulator [Alphaproteobacteria bacterium]|nr:sigma 54-interacting transcriptional regulator [Alphaproteobacteria bacterium]